MSKKGQEREDRSLPRRIEYVVARIVVALVRILPERAAYFLAETLLAFILLFARQFRQRALEHLDIAFGDTHDDAWRKRTATESFRQLAWYLIDVLTAAARVRSAAGLASVDLSELEEAFRRDGVTETTGALIISGHMGVPDAGSLAMALRGWPNSVIVRRLDNPFLWDWIHRRREGIPQVMMTKHGALRGAYKVLVKNGIVAMQPDQDARHNGIFVKYFGRAASTHGGAATLALTSQAPVYVVNCFRTKRRRFRFRVHCQGPLDFTPSGDHEADVKELTKLMTAGLEHDVRRYPEHNMWAHRRWKTRPPWSKQGQKQIARRKEQEDRKRAREARADAG